MVTAIHTTGEIQWWRHQMETFSALLTICAGNSPVIGQFPAQRPMTRSCSVFFDQRMNKRLRKQWRSRLVIWDAIVPIMTSLLWFFFQLRCDVYTVKIPEVCARKIGVNNLWLHSCHVTLDISGSHSDFNRVSSIGLRSSRINITKWLLADDVTRTVRGEFLSKFRWRVPWESTMPNNHQGSFATHDFTRIQPWCVFWPRKCLALSRFSRYEQRACQCKQIHSWCG